jgi:hypothetical protein
MWGATLAGVSIAGAWCYFGSDWPSEPAYVFYASYSVYSEEPWTVAGVLFVVLVAVRVVAVRRRARTSVVE